MEVAMRMRILFRVTARSTIVRSSIVRSIIDARIKRCVVRIK